MERTTNLKEVKKLFGNNFIGPDELTSISSFLSLEIPKKVPDISFTYEMLEEKSKDGYLLILTVPALKDGKSVNILNLKELFGQEPDISEPCFYNQDWYINEEFIKESLSLEWKLVKKDVFEHTRAKDPAVILKNTSFPKAIICTYTFFVYYFLNKEILWQYDFIWCSDKDHNGDRIYIAKYSDIDGVNKNGFSIHRHLALRDCYAAIDCN